MVIRTDNSILPSPRLAIVNCYPDTQMRHKLSFLVLTMAAPMLVGEEKVDLSMVHRIRTEALQNSKVMDHMFYLTDVNGPRLTGSPGYRAAADWVVKRMTEYGAVAKEEKWGPFGR